MGRARKSGNTIKRAKLLGLTIGGLLMVAGAVVGVVAEQGLLDYRHAADRHGGKILDLGDGGAPDSSQYGYMVRVTGVPKVVEAPFDAEFGQHVDTPVLIRHVEMFQWHEMRLGDQVHYEMDWIDHPVDSRRFQQPDSHVNPQNFAITGKQFAAGQVRLGGYVLGPEIERAILGSEPVEPNLNTLPTNLVASFTLYNGYLTTSSQPEQPRVGDLRVSWEQIPLRQITVFARLDGDQLVPAVDAADGKGFDLSAGDRPLTDVLPDVPREPIWTWPLRALAVLLASIGMLMWLSPRRRSTAGSLAFGVGLLIDGAVCGLCWLGSDMGIAVGALCVAVLGFALALWRWRATH